MHIGERDHRFTRSHIRDLCRPYAVEVRLNEPGGEGMSFTPATPTSQYMLTVRGPDKPGMLRLLSNKLSELGIDIRNLYAERCDQDATFTMELELAIPTSLDIAHVREEVSGRCREVGLDLTLEPAEEFFARCGRNLRDAVRAGTR